MQRQQRCGTGASILLESRRRQRQHATQGPPTLQKAVEGILVQAPSRSYSQPCCTQTKDGTALSQILPFSHRPRYVKPFASAAPASPSSHCWAGSRCCCCCCSSPACTSALSFFPALACTQTPPSSRMGTASGHRQPILARVGKRGAHTRPSRTPPRRSRPGRAPTSADMDCRIEQGLTDHLLDWSVVLAAERRSRPGRAPTSADVEQY